MIAGGVQRRVLLFESDAVFQDAIRKALSATGCRVVLAAAHEGEVEYVPDDIGVLLLDLDWPSPRSRFLLARLTALYPLAPVILLNETPGLCCFGQAHGVIRVIEKPVSLATLAGLIEEVLAEPGVAPRGETGGNSGETDPSHPISAMPGCRWPRRSVAPNGFWSLPPTSVAGPGK